MKKELIGGQEGGLPPFLFPDLFISLADLQRWFLSDYVCGERLDLISDCWPVIGGQRGGSTRRLMQPETWRKWALIGLSVPLPGIH